jgi:hypothetical protein
MKPWIIALLSGIGFVAGFGIAVALILTQPEVRNAAGCIVDKEDPRIAAWGLWIAALAFGATYAARRTELDLIDGLSHLLGAAGLSLALAAIGENFDATWVGVALGLLLGSAIIYSIAKEQHPPAPPNAAPSSIVSFVVGWLVLTSLFRRGGNSE